MFVKMDIQTLKIIQCCWISQTMFKNQTMVTTIEWWTISSVWIMVWGQTAWDPTANYTFNSWSMFICRTWSVLTYLHTLSPSKTMQHSISLDLKPKKHAKYIQIPFWCWPKCILWTNQPAALLLIYPLYVKVVFSESELQTCLLFDGLSPTVCDR